jgi:hypothetical protein
MTTKVCKKCKEVKPLTDFYKHPKTRDGKFHICKVCEIERGRKYRKNNPTYGKQHYHRNKEKYKAYHQNNKEKRNEYLKGWRKNNKAKICAYSAKRKSSKLQATPPWSDLEKIKEVYEEAQRLTELLGIKMHVDHIVPLQGELVCGLHIPSNLQILTAVENLRKSNKLVQSEEECGIL